MFGTRVGPILEMHPENFGVLQNPIRQVEPLDHLTLGRPTSLWAKRREGDVRIIGGWCRG